MRWHLQLAVGTFAIMLLAGIAQGANRYAVDYISYAYVEEDREAAARAMTLCVFDGGLRKTLAGILAEPGTPESIQWAEAQLDSASTAPLASRVVATVVDARAKDKSMGDVMKAVDGMDLLLWQRQWTLDAWLFCGKAGAPIYKTSAEAKRIGRAFIDGSSTEADNQMVHDTLKEVAAGNWKNWGLGDVDLFLLISLQTQPDLDLLDSFWNGKLPGADTLQGRGKLMELCAFSSSPEAHRWLVGKLVEIRDSARSDEMVSLAATSFVYLERVPAPDAEDFIWETLTVHSGNYHSYLDRIARLTRYRTLGSESRFEWNWPIVVDKETRILKELDESRSLPPRPFRMSFE